LVDDAGDTEAVSVPGAVARVLAGSDGLATTRAEAKDLIAATTAACAREKVRRMLRARERSRQEVAQKLLGEGYPRDVVDLVVEEAVATRILSDTRFAEAFVSSKLRAGWGRVRIERELTSRGVDLACVADLLDESVSEEDELQRAVEVASRHSVRGRDPYPKLCRYLASKGFSSEVVRKAARMALDGS